MGNWFSNFFEETGEFLSENAGAILTTAAGMSGIPVGQANTLKALGLVAGALGKKGSSAAEKTNALIQSGIDAQTAYQMAALDEVKSSGQQTRAIATADKQLGYDINRGQFASNQRNILPYQMASLSALQALPQLQQLLGLNAYNIPMSISQYTPPQVNYVDLYSKTQEQLYPTTDTAATAQTATTSNGGVGSGLRPSVVMGAPQGLEEAFIAATGRRPTGEAEMYQWEAAGRPTKDVFAAAQKEAFSRNAIVADMTAIGADLRTAMANPSARTVSGSMRPEYDSPQQQQAATQAAAAGGTTTQSLTPYTGAAYDLNNSPLYLWQKQQAEETLTNQLAAAGLSGGTYAQREMARIKQGLAAQERERVVGNLQYLTNLGMQGSGLGQSSFQAPSSSDLLNAGSSTAGRIVDIYGNLGNIAGVGATQLAQNNTAAYNAQQGGTSVWQDLYELGSSSGWWGNNKSKSSSSSSSSSSSTPYTTSLGYTLPGEFDFKGW